MNNNHLIIMAGGVGSRFWPMSIPEKPKQFIDVMGVGKTMIQLTVERFSGVIEPDHVWIVTSKKYKEMVMQQLPEVPEQQILMEPCMRNTAPCIEYVSRKIYAKYPDANLVFSPADHIVLDAPHFKDVIKESLDFTKDKDVIVTLGMMPTRPETGYGYIKEVPRVSEVSKGSIVAVEAFKEKPNLETAKAYLAEGGYFWNAGIFVWNVKMVVNTIKRLVPDLAEIFDRIEPHFYKDDEQNIIDELFPTCPNISVDYAVMEKSKDVFVYPASFGWSDIGTWGSLYTHINPDENGNAVIGENIRTVDSMNCIIRSFGKKKVIVQGLDNYIVVDDNDCLLICKMQDEQLIKEWQK
ncbi:MAG: mannose-1-phosphate guanylyltransferase [Bacteroidia bacterium]|nr:mannose-1-phosphate guanylyltransferase [Bacteroidia bacterium]